VAQRLNKHSPIRDLQTRQRTACVHHLRVIFTISDRLNHRPQGSITKTPQGLQIRRTQCAVLLRRPQERPDRSRTSTNKKFSSGDPLTLIA